MHVRHHEGEEIPLPPLASPAADPPVKSRSGSVNLVVVGVLFVFVFLYGVSVFCVVSLSLL